MYVCVCVLSCACEYRFLWKPEEDIESLKVGATSSCELSGRDFGDLTQVLYKNCYALNYGAICQAQKFTI